MSTPHNTGIATDPSIEILAAIRELDYKIDRLERAARIPHIPPSTMATALLLTGTTGRSQIASAIGVSIQTLRVSPVFAAFRMAEGAIRSRGAVASRRKSGDDFTE